MAKAPTAPASDLFRFVSVRGPNTPEADALKRRFVQWGQVEDRLLQGFVQSAQNAGKPISPVLHLDMPKLAPPAETEALQKRMVVLFRTQSPLALTASPLDTQYPWPLYDAYLWHRDHNQQHDVQVKDFLTAVEAALGVTAANFIAAPNYFESKLALWENLIAEYVEPSPTRILSGLQSLIRWYWIIERMAGAGFKDGQDIYEAMHATVILPQGVFRAAPVVDPQDQPNTRQMPSEKTREKDLERLKDLKGAADDLRRALEIQAIDARHAANHCDPPAPTDKARLTARYVEVLSAATHAVLDSLDVPKSRGVDVKHVLDRIDHERQTIADKHASPPQTPTTARINGRLIEIDGMCHHYSALSPCQPYQGPTLPRGCGLIRAPGYADLKVIRSTLLKYEKGEIAHVENVLLGEEKIREFNTLTRTEDTLTNETDVTSETQKETQSTDRFELERELSSMVKEDMKFDTGVKVTASLGPVSLNSNVGFSYERQKEESNKTATRNAREIVDRALSRVVERTHTTRATTTITQTEDRNKHTLNNIKGKENIHGVYYWLDKYYLSKVVNYGKRLMFEFVVPEPAAYYIYSKTHRPEDPDARKRPDAPATKPYYQDADGVWRLTPLTSFEQITVDNYGTLAAAYGAKDVAPPPPETRVVVSSVKADVLEWQHPARNDKDETVSEYPVASTVKDLQVPAGYLADRGFVTIAGRGVDYSSNDIAVLLGRSKRGGTGTDFRYTQEFYPLGSGVDAPDREDGFVPFAIWAASRHELVANIEIICQRTPSCFAAWQQATFNAIMTAYATRMSEYVEWRKQAEVSAGVPISGANSDANRAVEREELKKHCIEMMSGQRFETFDAVRSNVPDLMYPEFSINEAFAEGAYIQFFEQAFEWEQVTYIFYPYFWGRKPNWVAAKNFEDLDPLFTNFLQAGAARVLVPARPGFEGNVVHYFASNGQIWGEHGTPPIPGDPAWIAIVDEIKEQQGQFTGGEQEGTPWIYKVPTSLVYLEDLGVALPDNSPKYPIDLAAIDAAKTSADFR